MFATKLPGLDPLDGGTALQGVLFAFVGALGAELLLSGFLSESTMSSTAGRLVVCALALYTIHRFAVTSFRLYKPRLKDLLSLTVVLLMSLLNISVGRIISLSLAKYFRGIDPAYNVLANSFEYAIPFAAGGLLLQAIFGFQYGLVLAVSLATIVGMYTPSHPIFFAYVVVVTLVACLSLGQFRSRSAYLHAGVKVALLSLPFACASILLESNLTVNDILIRLGGVLISGILSAILAAGAIPVLEYVGGYVTDLRLIEMATLDHPLLKELSVQCPGTWNHSMVMGMMVESAAASINANPVMARVGAYFHDIGKIRKPLYFVENQGGEENRHDKLSSSMSALIIRSHVKDGIDLARKHGIPQKIEDMIPQHHGTSRIEFFYDKALKEAEEAGAPVSSVDANLYSYPGPKPQTKEAGILMLADGIEAAARTVGDPTQDRIQGLVQKMINKVFASGELDECELTLKDLHAIAKSFTRVLTGIYHQRVAYAEPAEKVNEKKITDETTQPEVDSRVTGKDRKGGAEDRDPKEGDKEDLKRLGL